MSMRKVQFCSGTLLRTFLLFSRFAGCGARVGRGRLYTTTQVCVPAGLHVARSGHSEPRRLAGNYGESRSNLLEPSRFMENLTSFYERTVNTNTPSSPAVWHVDQLFRGTIVNRSCVRYKNLYTWKYFPIFTSKYQYLVLFNIVPRNGTGHVA